MREQQSVPACRSSTDVTTSANSRACHQHPRLAGPHRVAISADDARALGDQQMLKTTTSRARSGGRKDESAGSGCTTASQLGWTAPADRSRFRGPSLFPQPILDAQSVDTRELLLVVRDEYEVKRHRPARLRLALSASGTPSQPPHSAALWRQPCL
jgi:hypothetical protein